MQSGTAMTITEDVTTTGFVVTLKEDYSVVEGDYDFKVIATARGGASSEFESKFKITEGAKATPDVTLTTPTGVKLAQFNMGDDSVPVSDSFEGDG